MDPHRPEHSSGHSKAAANYMNSQLIRMEASFNGYTRASRSIPAATSAKAPAMNVFLVHDGVLYTPHLPPAFFPASPATPSSSWPKT